jgi:hypothetical protein
MAALHLDLAGTFARYTVSRSQLFKGRRLLRQPARGEDSTLARVKRRHGTLQGLMAISGLLLLGERCFLGWCGSNKPIQYIAGLARSASSGDTRLRSYSAAHSIRPPVLNGADAPPGIAPGRVHH